MKDLTLKYCTYITFYSGNKLPPFYIGYGMVDNILNKNYHGSVTSRVYKALWLDELKENPHLFKTVILSTYDNNTKAQAREIKLLRFFRANMNPMYINKGIAGRHNNTNMIRITNGIINKMIFLNETIPDGWERGMNADFSETLSKSLKGVSHTFSEEGLRKRKLQKSGENSSSKRPEIRAKISNTLTGRTYVDISGKDGANVRKEQLRERMSTNNPFKGKHHSHATIQLNSDAHKGIVVAKDINGNMVRVTVDEFNNRNDLFGIQTGSVWINNGIISKKCYGEVADGWVIGRLPFHDPLKVKDFPNQFRGYYITPKGKFKTAFDAGIAHDLPSHIIATRCKTKNNSVILVNRTPDYTDDIKGKQWKTLGWGFEPVDKKKDVVVKNGRI
jgi:hypothetical protein